MKKIIIRFNKLIPKSKSKYKKDFKQIQNVNDTPLGVIESKTTVDDTIDLEEISLKAFNSLKKDMIMKIFKTCNTSFLDTSLNQKENSNIIVVYLESPDKQLTDLDTGQGENEMDRDVLTSVITEVMLKVMPPMVKTAVDEAVKEATKDIRADIKEIKKDIRDLKTRVGRLESDVRELKKDVRQLKKEAIKHGWKIK